MADANEHVAEPSSVGEAGRPGRQRVGGYEIVAAVGRGGMGAVFKAIQVSMGRVVALKILPRKLARNAAYVQRFLREARSEANRPGTPGRRYSAAPRPGRRRRSLPRCSGLGAGSTFVWLPAFSSLLRPPLFYGR